jgi:hypothetical protein
MNQITTIQQNSVQVHHTDWPSILGAVTCGTMEGHETRDRLILETRLKMQYVTDARNTVM